MKKMIEFLIVLVILLSAVVQIYAATEKLKSAQTDREDVILIIRTSITLNEEYKKSVKKDSLIDRKRKRAELETYDEQKLFPVLPKMVTLLSSGFDKELAAEYMNLLLSYENSADESLSYHLGEIFLKNPGVIEKTIAKYAKKDQEYFLQQLEWGLDNVIHNNKTDRRIQDRRKRLRQLRSGIEKQ